MNEMEEQKKTAPVIAECPDYSRANVRSALEQLLTELGGLDWVRPGMTVGIKLNLCSLQKPEKAATTHPVMAAELAKLLTARGAEVIIGDSPGEPFNAPMMNRVYSVTGVRECEGDHIRLNSDYGFYEAEFPEGVSVRTFSCVSWLRDCDAVINFCKLKSHGLMGMTAAVKNLYGVIPGIVKSEYHFRHTDPMDFANMLVDLNEYIRPVLCLCDAVEIMEGNGPTQGNPRHLGLLIAGRDPYELDRLCANILGIKETEIPYMTAAAQRKLFRTDSAAAYDRMAAPYRLNDFERSGATSGWFAADGNDKQVKKILKKGLYLLMRSSPKLEEGCVGCGHCEAGCPAKAITIVNKKAVINRKLCVRCFCCQEFCPTGAMKVQRSLTARLLVK